MPFWFDTFQDAECGGYRLPDLPGSSRAETRQLVGHSNLIWGFSHAHLNGFSGARRYLDAARQGFQFLLAHFVDRRHGGCYWRTDRAGEPIDSRKLLYGQAIVIHALVELHRASGDDSPLEVGRGLHGLVERSARDERHGGWMEHFERDWRPVADDRSEIEIPGLKSANTALHWMEALAELYQVTGDEHIERSLVEALRINSRFFDPQAPGRCCVYRNPDWTAYESQPDRSYGHEVEFGWMMVRAEQILGRPPFWSRLFTCLDDVLETGFDHDRGGLYLDSRRGPDAEKVWWGQAELLSALTDAVRSRPDQRYQVALKKLLDFLLAHVIDPNDGIWWESVSASGDVRKAAKAHHWKTPYHDVRAIVKFSDTFGAVSA